MLSLLMCSVEMNSGVFASFVPFVLAGRRAVSPTMVWTKPPDSNYLPVSGGVHLRC